MALSINNLSNSSYTKQAPPIVLDNDISFSGGTNYEGGYIEFSLDTPTSFDNLTLITDASPSTVNSQISIFGNKVYIGNGTQAVVVGSVDPTFNGQNGQKLRINLSNDFENGNFNLGSPGSTTIPGWTRVNQQVKFGIDTIANLPTPIDTTIPANASNADKNTVASPGSMTTVLDSTQNDGSGNSVKLTSSGITTAQGYDIVRGPYIYSNSTVNLLVGDQVSFEWQAQGGDDAYDVYGYIVDVKTGYIDTILNETGSSGSASTTWATKTITVSQAGEYKFVFVAGTYDFSGGTGAGAQVYIDDVTVTQAMPTVVNDTYLSTIARRVQYNNTSENPDTSKTLTVSVENNASQTASATATINITSVNNAPVLTINNTSDDVFNITSQDVKTTLQIQLTGHSSQLVNELALFTVDDAKGTINGIAPSAEGYAKAALERSEVILSAIANTPNGFDPNNLSTLLQLNSGQNFRFLLVQDDTLDSVRNDPNSIGKLLFSSVSTQKIIALRDNSFSLGWKNASGNSSTDFNDLVVKITQTNQALALGTDIQGKFQGEAIDLRDIKQSVKADFKVYREASYNDYIGFYQVTDENGGIDTNGDGKADILTGQAGYTQAAVRGRVAGIDLTVSNQGTATYNSTFQPGAIFVPFIIVNGRPDAVLNNNSNNALAVYFPFLGANSDRSDHIRLLASNTFGFEDLSGGGDKDFNDLIIKANLTTTN